MSLKWQIGGLGGWVVDLKVPSSGWTRVFFRLWGLVLSRIRHSPGPRIPLNRGSDWELKKRDQNRNPAIRTGASGEDCTEIDCQNGHSESGHLKNLISLRAHGGGMWSEAQEDGGHQCSELECKVQVGQW